MHTEVNKIKFVRQLQARLKELRKKRVGALKKYDDDVAAWRRDLHEWVVDRAHDRIQGITKTELRNARSYGRDTDHGFGTCKFFIGAPKPPRWPSDMQIRAIQNTLQQLGLMTQTTIRLSTTETAKYLDDAYKDREDLD